MENGREGAQRWRVLLVVVDPYSKTNSTQDVTSCVSTFFGLNLLKLVYFQRFNYIYLNKRMR